MCQLVDHGDLRAPGEDGRHVHFLQRHAAVLNLALRHLLEIANPRQGVGAAVRFNERDDDVEALTAQLVGVLEHPVSLADARRGADVQA